MAVAPLPNVRRVLDYALTEIPADKIFLGIPNYGYNWKLPYERGVTAAVTLGNLTAVDLAIETGSEIIFDELSQSPYFYYTDSSGAARVVWLLEPYETFSAEFFAVKQYVQYYKSVRGLNFCAVIWHTAYKEVTGTEQKSASGRCKAQNPCFSFLQRNRDFL